MTNKMKAFCQEYIANGYNGTKAYLAVYDGRTDFPFESPSYRTASVNSSKFLKKKEILDYIKELQHERYEALSINADRIATELSTIAFGEVGSERSENGKLKALDLLQKQLGLQNQKIEAKVEETVITVSVDED